MGGFSRVLTLEIERPTGSRLGDISQKAQEYHQTMSKVNQDTYNMWNRVRDNPNAVGAIEDEAYREGIKHPIGFSMSIPQQRQDAMAAARKYPRKRGYLLTSGGKFGMPLALAPLDTTPAYNIAAEEAWNRGWQRAADEQKKRLERFNSTDRMYQTYTTRRSW